MSLDIPEVVIERLPQYLRSLRALKNRNIALVSSADLGIESGVTPAQIRKDLSYFGKFGKQGQGYNVKALTDDLTSKFCCCYKSRDLLYKPRFIN